MGEKSLGTLEGALIYYRPRPGHGTAYEESDQEANDGETKLLLLAELFGAIYRSIDSPEQKQPCAFEQGLDPGGGEWPP